jgi:hypothetical protein
MTDSAEKFTRQTLLDVQPLTPHLFTLRTTRDRGFRFRAGQFARLGVAKADGATVWRAYSMVSSPFDEFLEFFPSWFPMANSPANSAACSRVTNCWWIARLLAT